MIRATVETKYFRKFLYVFLGCVAYSGWRLYDGLIGYPNKLVIAEAYETIPEDDRRTYVLLGEERYQPPTNQTDANGHWGRFKQLARESGVKGSHLQAVVSCPLICSQCNSCSQMGTAPLETNLFSSSIIRNASNTIF